MNSFIFGYRNLLRRKLRNVLTICGVAVIVMSFFSLFTFSEGYQTALENEFKSLGIQLLAVPKGCPYEMTILILHGGEIEKNLNALQLDQIKQHPDVKVATPLLLQKISSEDLSVNTVLYGVQPDFAQVKPLWRMHEISFSTNSALECWVGFRLANTLSVQVGDMLPITFGDTTLQVVGILPQTRTADDQFVFAPLGTVQSILSSPATFKAIAIQLKPEARVGVVKEELSQIPDVQVVSYRQAEYTLNDLIDTTRDLLQIAIWLIALIGMMGVVSTVLMSLEERRKEIGMMKALGATTMQITVQLSIETLVTVFVGSVLGILFAIIMNQSIELLLKNLIQNTPSGSLSIFSFSSIGVTLAVSLALGLLASVIPLLMIRNISPLEAIRNEE